MTARFAPTPLRVDTSKLSSGDRRPLVKLIEAARILNDIFLMQYWSGESALYARLQKDTTPLGKARLHYFWINKGPWSELDDSRPSCRRSAGETEGANFYPENMSKRISKAGLRNSAERATGTGQEFFHCHSLEDDRGKGHQQLMAIPYSEEYADDLTRAAAC